MLTLLRVPLFLVHGERFALAVTFVSLRGSASRAHSGLIGALLLTRDKAVALAFEPVSGDLFRAAELRVRAAHGIEIGGIEKVDPRVGRGVEDAVRFRLVGLLSKSRRAEAQTGDGHASAAKPRELHSA